ncbi:MAG: carboxypeptidase-like regulatory domain-containing protein, partial [Sphingobacteriales bacterium]
PVKPVLQSLLAQMYWNYYQQNRYQFTQRTKLAKADTDFTKWDLRTIISETSHLYDLSLRDAAKEQNTPIGVLDGVLEGDKSTRYLRPTLYDLLVQRAFDFFLTDEADLPKPKLPFSLNDPRFFGGSRAFANLVIKTTDTASTAYKGIKYLQQATAFHLTHGGQEAVADLDLQRLKFLYSHSHVEHKDSLYLSALKQIATVFSAKPISAEALVLEGQYYQGLDSLTIAHGFFKQAVEKYPESLGGKNAVQLIKQIEEKKITATVEDINMPNRPLLALISYKNLTSAKVAIYRLSNAQLKEYNEGYSTYSQKGRAQFQLGFVKKLSPVETKAINWPDLGDYRDHSLEFKIDPLPSGNYVLVVKDGATDSVNLTGLCPFRISALAYTARVVPNGNLEMRVMNRETGAPLNHQKIQLKKRIAHYDSSGKLQWTYIDEDGLSDENGLYNSRNFSQNDNMEVRLTNSGDTLIDGSKYFYGARENFNGPDPQDKTIIFTDRQIYRPGQTVYFKGVQIQTTKGQSKIMPGQTEEIEFLDANDKKISSLKLLTNEFGTFSGNFIVPQNTLNGVMTLRTDEGSMRIRIEEYKRPTFQVAFLPVKGSYKLNDSVIVRGTVLAFSGYGLSQAKVAYHITRTQQFRLLENNGRPFYNPGYRYNPETTEIKTDTITTDNQGNFTIKFKASPGETDDVNKTNFNYAINADVTDASGETRSSQTSVIVGNNNLLINNNIPAEIFANDTLKVPISIQNLNGQLQKGRIKIEIYSLKQPGQVFKDRVWQTPDQFVINPTDFRRDFPDYAYRNEDIVSNWKKLAKITTISMAADDQKPGMVNLGSLTKQPSGMYEVAINARDENGDTSSIIKYINVIGESSNPVKYSNWVVPVSNMVKPGEAAEFLVGVNKKINVLMERYSADKLVSSKWITIDSVQQRIKIPVAVADNDVVVQFMMVYKNRFYASYQKIIISDPDKTLAIKFITFRNKLQPGEKEQWKLQVSDRDGDKNAAEMLACLYDASLDDILPPQNWKNALDPAFRYQPNYYAWIENGFVTAVNTLPVDYQQFFYIPSTRNYEQLNILGYNYYGGYNDSYQNYLQRAKKNVIVTDNNRLNELYQKNASLIKNGYDITGRVIASSDKFHLPGVRVSIKGTNITTFTNSNGNFKIKVPVKGVLVFSFVGYDPQEISTQKGENITVALKESSAMLNEVVVTGYSSQRKRDISGSVAVVEVADAKVVSATSSNQSLQGKVAGVSINSGAQGANQKVFIRGVSSFDEITRPIALRTNFAETAFFYPQLHTNEKGEILIDFTIPEALTRWKFRALAHT